MSGGKESDILQRATWLTGRVRPARHSPRTRLPRAKRWLTRTHALPLLQSSVRVSQKNGKTPKVFRFLQSCSAVAARLPFRWYIRPATGTTAYSLALSSVQKSPRLLQSMLLKSEKSAATPSQSCPSVDTTWATTLVTGLTSERLQKRTARLTNCPRFSTSTGSARTKTTRICRADLCGRAMATTAACSHGFSTAVTA